MPSPVPGSDDWLALVIEEAVEPEIAIVDPHHHLWPTGGALPYGIDALHRDTGSGHRIEQTVFIECHASYDTEAPPEFAPVGETRFVAETAMNDPTRLISGIVAHADLRSSRLDEILDAHVAVAHGLLRGIRDALSRAEHPEVLRIPGRAPAGLFADAAFRRGVRRLSERHLTYDTWHYHYQNRELLELARAVPETTMVLDHFGTPLGVGPYTDHRDEIYEQWKRDISDLASCPNVVAKLGGLAMPDNGFGWDTALRPPTSDEFVAAQARYYAHTIDAFGPQRCMFESNFPVDRWSLGYGVFWNACKKMTAGFSPSEREAMFAGTARRVYRL
jgi:L-fuconolactonase